MRRAGLAACQARVRVDDDVPARRAAELLTLAQAAVPAAAGRLAAAAITALAEAEGRIHGVPRPRCTCTSWAGWTRLWTP